MNNLETDLALVIYTTQIKVPIQTTEVALRPFLDTPMLIKDHFIRLPPMVVVVVVVGYKYRAFTSHHKAMAATTENEVLIPGFACMRWW